MNIDQHDRFLPFGICFRRPRRKAGTSGDGAPGPADIGVTDPSALPDALDVNAPGIDAEASESPSYSDYLSGSVSYTDYLIYRRGGSDSAVREQAAEARAQQEAVAAADGRRTSQSQSGGAGTGPGHFRS